MKMACGNAWISSADGDVWVLAGGRAIRLACEIGWGIRHIGMLRQRGA